MATGANGPGPDIGVLVQGVRALLLYPFEGKSAFGSDKRTRAPVRLGKTEIRLQLSALDSRRKEETKKSCAGNWRTRELVSKFGAGAAFSDWLNAEIAKASS